MASPLVKRSNSSLLSPGRFFLLVLLNIADALSSNYSLELPRLGSCAGVITGSSRSCGNRIGQIQGLTADACCTQCGYIGSVTHWDFNAATAMCNCYEGSQDCSKADTQFSNGCVSAPCPAPAPPAPPAPAPPAGSCPAGWLKFNSAAALAANAWGDYFKLVYGVPSFTYPFCTADMWMLYDNLLSKAKVTGLPKSVGKCPAAGVASGQHYDTNNMFQSDHTSWVWHPYPWRAFAKDTWIEVLHRADPFGDEHFGAWLMYARGSGIWFNTGITRAYSEHSEAYKDFKVNSNEPLAKAAATAGVVSLQFLAHVDPVEYKQCPAWKYMNIEILASKLVGTYACTTADGAPNEIKAGWEGSKVCICDNTQNYLNCNGLKSRWIDSAIV